MSVNVLTVSDSARRSALWLGGTVAAVVLWLAVYWPLERMSGWVVSKLGLARRSHLDEAVRFFAYDTPKVLLLLTLVVFGMGVVRSFFSPERTRALLAGRQEGFANFAAAALGVVTPFCSCSAVPLFVGFVSAGVPLGVTFSFLIAAPMVNEVALGLLFALLGWQVAVTYLAFGFSTAVVSGWVIGALNLEDWLEEWVRDARSGAIDMPIESMTVADRIKAGVEAVRDIVGRVWLWIIAGIAAGAFIHGYVPDDLLASIMGKGAWWSVPAVVLIGIPIYSNAAGVVPVVLALLGKGAALGTVLAFMMSVIALSLPEMIILRKVMTIRLIAVFVGIVATGILSSATCSTCCSVRKEVDEKRQSAGARLQALRSNRTHASIRGGEAWGRGQCRESDRLRRVCKIRRRCDSWDRDRREGGPRRRLAEARRSGQMAFGLGTPLTCLFEWRFSGAFTRLSSRARSHSGASSPTASFAKSRAFSPPP